jgi:hypothetical protein
MRAPRDPEGLVALELLCSFSANETILAFVLEFEVALWFEAQLLGLAINLIALV